MIRIALVLLLVVAPTELNAQDASLSDAWPRMGARSVLFAPVDSAFLDMAVLPDEAAYPVVLMLRMDRRRGAVRGAIIGALTVGITVAGVALYYFRDEGLNGALYVGAFGAQGAVVGAVVGGIIGALVGGPQKEEGR